MTLFTHIKSSREDTPVIQYGRGAEFRRNDTFLNLKPETLNLHAKIRSTQSIFR